MIPSEINIDSTIAYPADQFEVALNDSEAFRSRVSAASLRTGLLDVDLTPVFVNHLTAGVVDTRELHITPNRMTTVLRGRDAVALALDTTVYVSYAVVVEQPAESEDPVTVPGFPSLPVTPGVTVPEIVHGRWTASSIAADLCRRVGLTLAWSADDYTLREDTIVDGPILPVIQALVDPFSHFEPSKVDIWAEGTLLIVRPRGGAGAGLTMDVHDARITQMTMKEKYLDLIRVLRITGSRTGTTNGYFAVDPGDDDSETTDETTNKLGEVVLRVVTKERRRVLDGAVKSQTIETYRQTVRADPSVTTAAGDPVFVKVPLHLVHVSETVSDWDDLVLAYPNVKVNQPKEHNRVITDSGLAVTDQGVETGSFGILSETTISHSYDANGYLKMANTEKSSWNESAKRFEVVSMESKAYRANGTGYQITTTQYGSDGVPGDVRRTTANGTPPGGPGQRSGGGGAAAPGLEPIVYATVISTVPGSKDVSIANANLLPEHVAIIAAQAAASSGKIETEISVTMAGMPWIRKGQRLQLTGLYAEDGTTPIVLQDGVVSEVRIEYSESSESPTYLSFIKILYYGA